MSIPTSLLPPPRDSVKLSEQLGMLSRRLTIVPVRPSWFCVLDEHHRTWTQVVEALVAEVEAWRRLTNAAIFRIDIITHKPLEGGRVGAEAEALAIQVPRGEDTAEVQKLLDQGRRGQDRIRITSWSPVPLLQV